MAADSIVNRNEYLSDHYLDALVHDDLKGLRGRWEAAEGRGEATARSRVRGMAKAYFAARAGAALGDGEAVRGLHDVVLGALGFGGRGEVVLTRGGEELVVRAAATCRTHTGLLLVALDLGFAAEVDAALDAEEAGRLLEPVRAGRESIGDPTDAAAHLFAADEPPRYVLLLAGAVVVLADRHRWAEGRFLAVNLDPALDRHDTRAKGELEMIASLFSADALVPEEGAAVLDTLVAGSRKHAVGVSKELREGVRQAVEVLAGEVIEQRVATGQAVYNVPDLAGDLTRQCLRFLYRLLFLLYAEARPELGILPVDAPEYQEGYGLDRLRDLALTTLVGDDARNGTHLNESLSLLFRLVNDGHNHGESQGTLTAEGDVGLVFEPLRSELFAPASTPLLDSVRLRNEALQKVLRLLLLSKEQKGRDRGFVSYAQLGINQLGAVYEGLMAYTGFFAKDEDLYEVARGGDPDRGTWTVPVRDADRYPDEVFVTRPDPESGEPRRVRHPKGSFVYRLSGRERQRSASYYTPEVLTRCVVKHSLAELLDDATPASRLLELTICEPALGSGAFLNEAVSQLAAEYLRRRQAELGRTIDPEAYPHELQKAKAHIALHQCYGVDLNATAVELAEVSLWLGCMHRGLQAPWFGLHLRRGNSLVGARRATYRGDQLAKRAWLKAAPADRTLAGDEVPPGEIHHFLLPARDWGAVASTRQAKELAPEAADERKRWQRAVTRAPSPRDAQRLAALAQQVERLWKLAAARLARAEADLRRPIAVWGQPDPGTREPASHQAVERELAAYEPLRRLRLVMDAWCALWFWPLDGPEPPDQAQWLDALEALLGIAPEGDRVGQLNLLDRLEAPRDPDEEQRHLVREFRMREIDEVDRAHPWLATVRDLADREGFWHWELELAHVFTCGGFDLQLGNPPWVRLDWEDDLTLAEFDPWFGVTDHIPVELFRDRRAAVLASEQNMVEYQGELASGAGLDEFLGSAPLRPLLVGIRTNLYMVFMETTWRHMAPGSVVGLLHPEGHFVDPRGGKLREAAYRRLRRHFQFLNDLRLFEDVHNTRVYGIHIYGGDRPVSFLQISNGRHPSIVDGSFDHDGTGELPGIQYPEGGWDLRPHAARILTIDERTLGSWARLFDDPGTQAAHARLLRPVTRADLQALKVIADQPLRLGDHSYDLSAGLNESIAKVDGQIRWETSTPASWNEAILQGPHFSVATPFARQPNERCKSNRDYSIWDLECLPEKVVPRTNYQRACDRDSYDAAIQYWNGRLSTRYWRLTWRRMADPSMERSLHAALLLPGPTHVHTVHSLAGLDDRTTAVWAGLWSSLPFDYLVKVSGKSDVQDELVRRLPAPRESPFYPALLLRTLRLNCLIRDYAPLWEELWDPAWERDRWTDPEGTRPELGAVTPRWTMATPLRVDYDRRMALVELDALAALILGLSAEQLCAMYRTQFAVLRKYEYKMWFDANGRRVSDDVVKEWQRHGERAELGRFELPFRQPDREKEMTRAYEEFRRRLAAGEL